MAANATGARVAGGREVWMARGKKWDPDTVRKARALLDQLATGSEDESPTLAELWPKFWTAAGRHLKSHMRSFLSWNSICDVRGSDGVALMDRPALTVTLEIAEELREIRSNTVNRCGRKYKINSVNKDLQVLQRLLSWAADAHLLPYCPLKGLRLERDLASIRHTRIRTEEDLQTLLVQCDDMIRALVLVLIDSGMRRAEAMTLRREQLTVNADGTGVVFLPGAITKNGRPRRPRLTRRAVDALLSLPNVGEHFFSNPDTGRPHCFNYLYARFREAVARSGLQGFNGEAITLHSLKHSFIYRARRDWKWSDRRVMYQTGNRSSAVFNTYGELDDDELDQAISEASRKQDGPAETRPIRVVQVPASKPVHRSPFAPCTDFRPKRGR